MTDYIIMGVIIGIITSINIHLIKNSKINKDEEEFINNLDYFCESIRNEINGMQTKLYCNEQNIKTLEKTINNKQNNNYKEE